MKFASKMPITKGWSGERKYRVTDATGTNYLLRETELGQKARKEEEVRIMRLIGDYSFFITLNFEPTFDKEYEPENWGKAVNNENFRKAIFHGFDNITYIAARYPGDDPETHKSTAITPTGFSVNNGKG